MIGGVCVTAYLNTLTPCLFQNIDKKATEKNGFMNTKLSNKSAIKNVPL
jgi:hypothetical protein